MAAAMLDKPCLLGCGSMMRGCSFCCFNSFQLGISEEEVLFLTRRDTVGTFLWAFTTFFTLLLGAAFLLWGAALVAFCTAFIALCTFLAFFVLCTLLFV